MKNRSFPDASNGPKRTCLHQRKAKRRQEAEVRNGAWTLLTPFQQLAYLNKNTFTAHRQRARIAKQLNALG